MRADHSSPFAGDDLETCVTDGSNDLPDECIADVLGRLPFKLVLKTLPPSSPVLQRLVKERVGQWWPKWFLTEIESSGEFSKAGERLVRTYLAFLKLPSLVAAKGGVDRWLLAQSQQIRRIWHSESILGIIGNHHIALFDKKQMELTIFDTVKNREVSKVAVPWGGAKVSSSVVAFLYGTIEQLSPQSFALHLSYKNYSEISVWSWSASHSPQKIHEQQAPTLGLTSPYYPYHISLLRVSDDAYTTVSKLEASSMLRMEHWDIKKKARVRSIDTPNCFSRAQGNAAELEACLRTIESAGIRIASSYFSHISWFSVGIPVDKKTKLLPTLQDTLVFRPLAASDRRGDVTLFRAPPGITGFSIEFVTQNGDIIFRISDNIYSLNLWHLVKLGEKLLLETPKCDLTDA